MFNLYSGDTCLETAVTSADVSVAKAEWESMGWESVEARPMVKTPEFRNVEEIQAEKSWEAVEA